MTPKLSCAQARELAPEMALGTISGDDRASLIEHISSCGLCRMIVEELSGVADAILLLGPEHEPPGGFESEVLAQFHSPRARRRGIGLSAAAIVVATVIGAGSVFWITADEREVAEHYQAALDEANGEYFGVKPLQAPDGTKVGNVFAYQGHPSWVFVVFQDVDPGVYRAELVTHATTSLGTFELDTGATTWGTDIETNLKDVRALRFVGPEGDILEARF